MPQRRISRRDLFVFAAGVLTSYLGSVLSRHADPAEAPRLTKRFVDNVLATHRTGLFDGINSGLVQRLFLGSEILTTIPGTQHPEWRRRGHPADRLAQAFTGKVMSIVDVLSRTDVYIDTEDVLPASFRADIASFGAPVSNEFTAILFDYHGDDPYHLKLSEERTFPLRWAYLMDDPLTEAELDQWEGSPGFYPVRNWRIVDLASGTSKASLIREQRGQDDLLLVTRIRNFLDLRTFSAGNTITVVGGAHGLGTVGFGRLLRDDSVLSRTIEQAGDVEFQALFEVSDPQRLSRIDPYRDGLYDQFPRSIQMLEEVVRLQIPDQTYARAREKVVLGLSDYFRKHRGPADWVA